MSSDSGGAAGAPVERTDLLAYFHRACLRESSGRPPRIGLEHELLPIDPVTGAARAYRGPGGVERVFRDLLASGFEDPQRGDPPTRAMRGPLAINVEPGGQTEISGSPAASLADCERELRGAWDLLRESARAAGFRYIAHGIMPVSLAGEIEMVPKRRYRIMTEFFEARGGPRFRDMMRRTGSVQASFDYEDEADAGRKLRLALLAAPVTAALFANSPLAGGRPSGYASERTAIWLETDPARCGLVREAFEGEWSFERYLDFALRVPAILVRADDGGVASAGGRTFGDLLRNGIPPTPGVGGGAGRRATLADWELHLSTIFTDARLKGVVECRSADGPRPADVMGPPALWTGLLYDRAALEGATALLAPYLPLWEDMKRAAARDGLRARVDGRTTMLDLARALVGLAAQGLRARGLGGERYLAAAEESVRTGRAPADRVLELFARGGLPAVIADAAV